MRATNEHVSDARKKFRSTHRLSGSGETHLTVNGFHSFAVPHPRGVPLADGLHFVAGGCYCGRSWRRLLARGFRFLKARRWLAALDDFRNWLIREAA